MKRIMFLMFVMILMINPVLNSRDLTKKEEKNMLKIKVKGSGQAIVFQLNNSLAARELYNQLPLSITVENYSSNEKIFYPPKKLNITDTPLADAHAGTLAYYAPWGDVVMFFGSFGSAPGLYELGQVVSGGELIKELSGKIEIEKYISAENDNIKILIKIGEKYLIATLLNNATTKALIARFPLTLPLEDLYNREMCFRFKEALPTDNVENRGYEVGDIIYWPPRHSFVILYAQNGESFSMQKIGQIDKGVEIFKTTGDVLVTFEVLK